MSPWIKKIHMYTGLLNFTMLCVFGLAGLVATAEAPDIFEADIVPAATIFAFRVPGSASDRQAGELIRQRLRPLHSVGPDVHRNGQHELVADFYSVNGLVRATLIENDGQLRVETRRNSIWRFLDNAHATTMQAAAADWAVGA